VSGDDDVETTLAATEGTVSGDDDVETTLAATEGTVSGDDVFKVWFSWSKDHSQKMISPTL